MSSGTSNPAQPQSTHKPTTVVRLSGDEFVLFRRVDFTFLFEHVKYDRSIARYACIIKMIHYPLLSLAIALFYNTPKV
jgi:hypothetical protein